VAPNAGFGEELRNLSSDVKGEAQADGLREGEINPGKGRERQPRRVYFVHAGGVHQNTQCVRCASKIMVLLSSFLSSARAPRAQASASLVL